MKKLYVEKINSEFEKEQARLRTIKSGDKVYITDEWFDFFECEVITVNQDEGSLTVEDKSLINIRPKREDRIKIIEGFYTKEEAETVWKTPEFKNKPF